MQELTHIGLDVHKETIAVAVLRPGTSECDECVIANTPAALRKLLSRYPDRTALRTCYEAGPTGYDTHRLLSSRGVPCEVIAPSLIPRRSGLRVKSAWNGRLPRRHNSWVIHEPWKEPHAA